MVVKDAISTLESKNCRHEDKEAAYATLLKTMKGDSASMYDEEFKAHGLDLMKSLQHDILNSDEKVSVGALQVLHSCLEDKNLGSMGKGESLKMLQALLQCGHKSPSVDVIKQVISCLGAQKFQADVIKSKISTIVDHIEEMNMKVKSKSGSALEEIVFLFTRLDEQLDKDLKPFIPQCGRLIFPGLASASETVREMTLTLLEKFVNDLCAAPDLSRHVVKAISAGLAQSLKCLVTKNDSYVLRAWAVIIQVVGKELHKGSSINAMLEVIEVGFKSTPEARRQAFVSWRNLIDNFALDKNVISDPKRIKLIMMVLKIDNAKTEPVAVEKLKTWWHFVTSMGPKLSVNFEQVVYPLLQFCVGNGKLSSVAPLLGQSPRLALKSPGVNSPSSLMSPARGNMQQLPVFPAVQKLGCEVTAHILSPGKNSWNLAALPSEVSLSPTTFVKHAPIILMTLQELFKNLGKDVDEKLVLCNWKSLINNLKAAMDSPAKGECREIFSTFLSLLQFLVQNQVFGSKTLLNLIQQASGFPHKVLASTAYTISGLTLRACPALLLCELLLSSSVVEESNTNESYTKLFTSLVNAGASNVQGALLFIQTVTEMLEAQALCLGTPELLCKMWISLSITLQDIVNTTNEVNQGDALEYNFGCMYAVLQLPIGQQLPSKLSQVMCKTVVKTWKELYHSFARLSALVATAEANACLEEMSAKILQIWQPEFKDAVNMEFLATLCQKMIDCVDFSSITVSQAHGGLTLSPSKWARRRQKPMGNLHSFVHLLTKIQTETNSILTDMERDDLFTKKNTSVGSIPFVAHTLVEVYTKLFTHITTTGVISNCLGCLAEPMARLYQGGAKSNSLKLFVPSFITKLEKLWQEIANCVTGRYNGQYDTEFLEILSPLLEATFLHSRRAIKNQTLMLWNTTFSRSTSLDYPDSLKPVLCKVKEKTAIALPGWITCDDAAVIAETPFSEMSMGDSQAPAPVLPGMPSPKRQRGSMLNKHVSPVRKTSPGPKVSPVKVVDPKDVRNLFSSARKQIAVDFMPEEEFVVINSPSTKKKRVLTDHQREVLKEKRVLPAMYNNLDASQSQDISLMSHFGTDSQHGSATSSADAIVISSSESQDNSSHSKTSSKMRKESSEKDSSNIDSFATPQPVSSAPRRRSARIIVQRIDDVDDPDKTGDSLSKDSDASSRDDKESKILDSKDTGMQLTGKENGSNSAKSAGDTNQGCTETNTSTDDVVETTPSKGSSEEMDSPFGMFRKKSHPVVADDQSTSPKSLSQDSGTAKTNPHPRRISLRKVQSQDDIPLLGKPDNDKGKERRKEGGPEKGKSPRRVPLKKIDEHENEPKEKQSATRQTRSRHPSAPSSNLDKWILKTEEKLGSSKSDNLPSELSVSPTSEVPDDVEAESNVMASHTLVEDTQSPFKMCKQSLKQPDNSIAETPTKGEDSRSPPVRVFSARKLFVDGKAKDTETSSQDADTTVTTTGACDKDAIAVNHLTKSNELQDSEIVSSQGFETKTKEAGEKDRHTMFGFSQLDSQKEVEDESEAETQSKNLPASSESENLLPSSGDNNFSLDLMPTLASPSKGLQKFTLTDGSKSVSSDSSKATSGSSDLSSKPTSSSESDFNPSQPTLRDNSSQDKRRKRKKAIPKKYSPIKHEKRPTRNKALKKKYPCCRIPNLCDHKSEVESNSKNSEMKKKSKQVNKEISSDSKTKIEDVKNSPCKIGHGNSNTNTEKRQDVFIKNQEEEDNVTEILQVDNVSPEIGEVTPDMKSPSNATPQRRHSATKRRGRWMKRLSGKMMAKKSLNSKDDQNENSDSEEVASTRLRKRKQESPSDKLEKRLEPPGKKRKRSFQRLSGTPPKSKHLLRTRSRNLKRLSPSADPSPPRKMRKIRNNKSKQNTDDGDDDDEPLSAVQKRQSEGKEKMFNETPNIEVSDQIPEKDLINKELEEEDKPLSQIRCIATVKGCQRDKIIDLTEEDGTDLLAICVDDALNTALSQISASMQEDNKSDVLNSSQPANPSQSTDDSVFLSEGSLEPTPYSVTVDDSQDHLQAAQKTISLVKVNAEIETEEMEFVDETPVDLEENASASAEFESAWDRETSTEDRSQENLFTEEDAADQNMETAEQSSADVVSENYKNGIENCLEDEQESPITHDDSSEAEKTGMENPPKEHNLTENKSDENNGVQNLPEQMNVIENPTTVAVSNVDAPTGEEAPQKDQKEDQDLPSSGERINEEGGRLVESVQHQDRCDEVQSDQQEEHVLYDWSPTKSPSCSILKTSNGPLKTSAEPCNSVQNRRVSFAEPVVSGQSPVREKYHSESLPTSPLIKSRSGEGRSSLFVRSLGRASGYRKRLHSSSPRKEPSWSRLAAKNSLNSQSLTPQSSQSTHKPTPESQLDSTGPIFPDLVDCRKPLDDILPKLTSSLWYRGLCQLMKGRNLNTIGDLSSLTEVQVNQLPIRNPKIETVKATLNAYMNQHGLAKSTKDVETMEVVESPRSKGATFGQEVTPSSIADDGIKVLPSVEQDLKQWSPIKDPDSVKGNAEQTAMEASCSSLNKDIESRNKQSTSDTNRGHPRILSSLEELVERSQSAGLKDVSTAELFDIHQKLNSLFGSVVEEMKMRKPNS